MKRTRLNKRGAVTLQTVIIIAVLALGAAGGGIIIYNVVADKTEELAITNSLVEEFTSTEKERVDNLVDPVVPELGDASDPNDGTEDPQPKDSTGNDLPADPDVTVDPDVMQARTESGGGGQLQIAEPVPQISALSSHTCVIRGTERRVWCWGNNSNGQLGNGEIRVDFTTDFGSSIAVQATALEETNIRSVSAGHQFSCALLMDRTIKCWGLNRNGQLGMGIAGGTSNPPVQVVEVENATSVVTGYRYACALLANRTAKCWGNNRHGQLGNGVKGGPDESFPTPVTVGGATPLEDIKSISIHGERTCVLLTDKTARCWGANNYGQLGNGEPDNAPILNPVTVLESVGGAALGDIKSISLGFYHTCALLEDKTARCWGANNYGQLGNGDGTILQKTIPVPVFEIDNAISIIAGRAHTCAVLEDKTARCWGFNNTEQLGAGASSDRIASPVVVVELITDADGITTASALEDIKSILPGENHTCALLENGTARCWGNNRYGQLGNGIQDSENGEYPTPVLVAVGGATFENIAIT